MTWKRYSFQNNETSFACKWKKEKAFEWMNRYKLHLTILRCHFFSTYENLMVFTGYKFFKIQDSGIQHVLSNLPDFQTTPMNIEYDFMNWIWFDECMTTSKFTVHCILSGKISIYKYRYWNSLHLMITILGQTISW